MIDRTGDDHINPEFTHVFLLVTIDPKHLLKQNRGVVRILLMFTWELTKVMSKQYLSVSPRTHTSKGRNVYQEVTWHEENTPLSVFYYNSKLALQMCTNINMLAANIFMRKLLGYATMYS